MELASDVLFALILFFGAMVAGAMVLEYMMVLPAVSALPSGAAVETIKLMSPRAWRYLPACGAVATLSAAAALALNDDMAALETGLMIAGLAVVAGFLVLSAGLYRQEDLKVRGWPARDDQPEWPEALARLRRLHVGRTAMFLLAYALFVTVSVLV